MAASASLLAVALAVHFTSVHASLSLHWLRPFASLIAHSFLPVIHSNTLSLITVKTTCPRSLQFNEFINYMKRETQCKLIEWIEVVHSVQLKYSRSNGPESLHFLQFTSCNWVEMSWFSGPAFATSALRLHSHSISLSISETTHRNEWEMRWVNDYIACAARYPGCASFMSPCTSYSSFTHQLTFVFPSQRLHFL